MIDNISLIELARSSGFAEAALCSIDDFVEQEQIVLSQEPLKERRQLRFSPAEEYPQARSIAVLLWPYGPASAIRGDQVFVDSYYFASNAAYHAARDLQQRLHDAGCFAIANVSYPAKAAAVRAGLGFIGKNNLLITKAYGTRVVIILMATDIEPPEMKRQNWDSVCLGCGLCSAACPSGALTDEGMTHPERCLRNYMMEGSVVPTEAREAIGMNLIGCDVCQRVCPMQPQLPQSANSVAFHLADFVTRDSQLFSQSAARLAQQIGRNAARPQRIRAQAALLAGNSGNKAYLPVLKQWADSDFEAVSEHAKWAIDQICMKSPET